MSRTAMLVRHPRRTLATLATVLAAVGITVASGADFTAQAANPSNAFTAGTLSMSNSAGNSAVLTASGLRPGAAPVDGTVDIANTGSLSGAFTLTRDTPADSDGTNPLSGKLTLVIEDCGLFNGSTAPVCGDTDDNTIYNGAMSALTGARPLGTFQGGDKHRYRFRISLDGSADNNYQGDSSSVSFTWNAA